MRLESLSARDFRNFARVQVELTSRLNFFLGENGQGKTNLIEAVYLLCRGTSFRPAEATSLLRHFKREGLRGVQGHPLSEPQPAFESDRGRISGTFVKRTLDYFVEMAIEPGKKTAFVNGKRANATTLVSHFPCVLFSPESLAAIKEGPEQRRQLVDEILLNHDPKQGRLLREYSRALRSRNRLLRNLANQEGPRFETEESLNSLNKIYFILCTHLTTARISALRALEPWLREALHFILEESTGEISVDYLISGHSALEWNDSKIYDAITQRALELRFQEIQSGSSLVGPHKHDIKLLVGGNDSRFYCSQGQQRALILALKIAQIVYHHEVHQTYPILLLDDVLSELDTKKRANLMKFLEGISAQILITSTDLTWSEEFAIGHNSIFTVTNGQVGKV